MTETKWLRFKGRMHRLINRTHEDYEHEYNFNQTHVENAELKRKLIHFMNELSGHGPERLISYEPIDFLRGIIKEKEQLAADEVSKQWTTTLVKFIDELTEPYDLREGVTFQPTLEEFVKWFEQRIEYLVEFAADVELDACDKVLDENRNYASELILHSIRRPKPTLKSQALRDFETVKKLNPDVLPEILGTIEKALNSIPD